LLAGGAEVGLRGQRALDEVGRRRQVRVPDVVPVARRERRLRHPARRTPNGADARALGRKTRRAEADEADAPEDLLESASHAVRSDSSSTMRTFTSRPTTCISATETGRWKRTGPALPGLT